MSSLNKYGVDVTQRYGSLRELVGAQELGNTLYQHTRKANRYGLFCCGPAELETEALRSFISQGGKITSILACDQSDVFLLRAKKNLQSLWTEVNTMHLDLAQEAPAYKKMDALTIIQAVHHFDWSKEAGSGFQLLRNARSFLKEGGILAVIHSSPEQIMTQWPTQVSEEAAGKTRKVVACYTDNKMLERAITSHGFTEVDRKVLPGPYLCDQVNFAEWSFFTEEVREILAASFSFFKFLKDSGSWECYWREFEKKAESGELDQIRDRCEQIRLQTGVANLTLWKKES